MLWARTSMRIRSPSSTKRDRTVVDSFGRHVADAEAVGPTREAPVGDQSCVGASARTLHGPGDGQHLAHARTALRSLVADHHDVAGVDAVAEHGLHGAVLTVEDPGHALELLEVDAGHLEHGTLGRQASRSARQCRRCRGSAGRRGAPRRRRGPGGSSSSRFSATVLPVTVISSPWKERPLRATSA